MARDIVQEYLALRKEFADYISLDRCNVEGRVKGIKIRVRYNGGIVGGVYLNVRKPSIDRPDTLIIIGPLIQRVDVHSTIAIKSHEVVRHITYEGRRMAWERVSHDELLQEMSHMASYYRGIFETLYEPYDGDEVLILRASVLREMLRAFELSCVKLKGKGRKYRVVITIDFDRIQYLLKLDLAEILATIRLRDLVEILKVCEEMEIPLFTPGGEVLTMIGGKLYIPKYYKNMLEIMSKAESREDLHRALIETPIGPAVMFVEKLFGILELFTKAEERNPPKDQQVAKPHRKSLDTHY